MRRATRPALVLAAVAAAALPLHAEETKDAKDAKRPAKHLKLGIYGNPYAKPPVDSLIDVPRFHTEIEVPAKAFDTAALTAKMEWWMRDYELQYGSTPAGGMAPSVADMKAFRPHPADSVNIMPLVQWLSEKLGLGRDKR
jgi:hypothetical protein